MALRTERGEAPQDEKRFDELLERAPHEGPPRETREWTLPSGTKVKMREPTGLDEIRAQDDLDRHGTLVGSWSLMMRCTVAIDGQEFDQHTVTPELYRDKFGAKDFAALRIGFNEAFYLQEDDLDRFRKSGRTGLR